MNIKLNYKREYNNGIKVLFLLQVLKERKIDRNDATDKKFFFVNPFFFVIILSSLLYFINNVYEEKCFFFLFWFRGIFINHVFKCIHIPFM